MNILTSFSYNNNYVVYKDMIVEEFIVKVIQHSKTAIMLLAERRRYVCVAGVRLVILNFTIRKVSV